MSDTVVYGYIAPVLDCLTMCVWFGDFHPKDKLKWCRSEHVFIHFTQKSRAWAICQICPNFTTKLDLAHSNRLVLDHIMKIGNYLALVRPVRAWHAMLASAFLESMQISNKFKGLKGERKSKTLCFSQRSKLFTLHNRPVEGSSASNNE